MTKFCVKCGAPLGAGPFCVKCGANTRQMTDPTRPQAELSLLTLTRDVPSLYRDIARYPEMFLIDREGRLQPVPGAGQPFEKLKANVDALLARDSQ